MYRIERIKESSVLLHSEISGVVLQCCFEVINELGSGFLEKVYQNALYVVLREKGMDVSTEQHYDVLFRGHNIGKYFADLVVDGKVIVEVKSCKCLLPEHQAQLINYLKVVNIPVGLLVNFGSPRLEYKCVSV